MPKSKGHIVMQDDPNDDVAIRVEHVSKSFRLPHNKQNSLKGGLINIFNGDRSYEEQEVLKDVSFEIKKGEFFGIVGRNGSGKSTLLKMLAGIYTPTRGKIIVNGSLTPFIELGVGFNPELTGRENVYLNGALLGFNDKEVDAMYDDIVAFAELERFMDQRLKNYSSGMQVRLAFSIAIRARSDILLLDEVLAVGDAAFQQKCYEYFYKIKQAKQTVILVTHDMGAIKQFCDRVILIDAGRLVTIGEPDRVSLEYEKLNFSRPTEIQARQPAIRVENQKGEALKSFRYGEKITFTMRIPEGQNISIAGFVLRKNGEEIFATNTIGTEANLSSSKVSLILSPKIGNGVYDVIGGLFGDSRFDVKGFIEGPSFSIHGQPTHGKAGEEWHGISYIESEWV